MINPYIQRKTGSGSNYNFNLQELIKNFSFCEFIYNGSKYESIDFGGFFVMTDKQYVIGYNSGFGVGSHLSAWARFMKEINGGGYINNDDEIIYLSKVCQEKFITARMIYEMVNIDDNGSPKYFGYLHFNFPDKKISLNQLELFKQFYNEYNVDLRLAIAKSKGVFKVSFYSKKTGSVENLNSLNEILKYMEENVNYDYTEKNENEVVIGTPLLNSNINLLK